MLEDGGVKDVLFFFFFSYWEGMLMMKLLASVAPQIVVAEYCDMPPTSETECFHPDRITLGMFLEPQLFANGVVLALSFT